MKKINIIDNPFARLTKKYREKIPITKDSNKTGDITIHLIEIKKIVSEHVNTDMPTDYIAWMKLTNSYKDKKYQKSLRSRKSK